MIKARRTFLLSGAAPLGGRSFSFFSAAIIALTLRSLTSEQKSGQAIRGAIEIEGQLYVLLSLLQDAETGQRGYLLTGDETYLAPYDFSVRRFDSQLKVYRSSGC